jgi:hypothetical protein
MIPMRGGVINRMYGVTFNDKFKPSSESLFGTASLVIDSKPFPIDTVSPLSAGSDGAYLQNHFVVAGESKNWRLFRRK